MIWEYCKNCVALIFLMIVMKILYIVHAFNYGGIEQYILNLIDSLDRNKFEISVLGTSFPHLFPQKHELVKRDVRLHAFGNAGLMSQVGEYAQLLRSNKFDVIHIHGMPNTGVIWLLMGKIVSPRTKFIIHAHMGHRSVVMGKGWKTVLYKCCYYVTNVAYRLLTDVRAGCSYKAMQIQFGKSIGNHGLLLNNGINLSRFLADRKIRADSRNMICVARITDIKNPFFLIEVMEHLTARNRAWHLTWVGEGIMENEVRRVISEKGMEKYITMLGARKDIPELLKQHSFFLLASLYEAMPLTIIEAQASGCVCISSMASPETADCGALVRLPLSLGAEAWADKIEEMYANREEFEINKESLYQFDLQTTSKIVEDLYSSLCKG